MNTPPICWSFCKGQGQNVINLQGMRNRKWQWQKKKKIKVEIVLLCQSSSVSCLTVDLGFVFYKMILQGYMTCMNLIIGCRSFLKSQSE